MKLMINRKSKSFKIIACFLALNLILECVAPSVAFALTSGPSQPEVKSFEPAGTTQMVDLFSGDFTYDMPLFELPGPDGGYPFNMAYHSGISMEQEASWVGLGWNINPGAINRQMRGLPDEFKGDQINVKQDMKEMHTYGVNAGANLELFGGDFDKGTNTKGTGGGGMSLYYNNYRGFGFGFGPSISVHPTGQNGASIGIGLDFDTQNGVGGKLSLGYQGMSLNSSFNSINGPRLDVGTNVGHDKVAKDGRPVSVATSTPLLASPVYTYSPSVGMEYVTTPLSVTFKTGLGVGAYGSIMIGGFYNTQKLKETDVSRGAYGYYYLEDNAKDDASLLDFNRQAQTLVSATTRNLSIPSMTADFYSISGQGAGGMFRAWRNDHGAVYEPKAESTINGGSIGVDIGGTGLHWGIQANYNHGKSQSGKWVDENELESTYKYSTERSGDYEPAYFQVYGEPTLSNGDNLSNIGGSNAMRPNLEIKNGESGIYTLKNSWVDYKNLTSASNVTNSQKHLGALTRELRGTNIQPITNEWLLNGSNEILAEYDISYYNSTTPSTYLGSQTSLNRSGSNYKSHHFAGMTVLQPNGSRYVYGLPAMNTKHVVASFSVDEFSTSCGTTTVPTTNGTDINHKVSNTDQFLSRTETPVYAHSYMLTAVLGADYVDINNNGPDEADYGYWVKFTYAKADEDYKWRTPYKDAYFDRGVKSKFSDNKGSYTYGEKEIWYLAKAETKSHVAVFKLKSRTDAKEAQKELATTAGTNSLMALDEIQLFTRPEFETAETETDYSAATPLQTIKFTYDNSLCDKIENGTTGKLTLKEVAFTYQKNQRGALNPYKFSYSSSNPDYDQYRYDRWGNYTEQTDRCDNRELPYVKQFDAELSQTKTNRDNFKSLRDSLAQSWHLTQIETPTGSTIDIEYESDDYAYVQHRKATQMFEIDKLELAADAVYDNGISSTYQNNDSRVYVKLEHPIPVSSPNAAQEFYDQYLKGLERKSGNSTYVQIFFKNYMVFRDNIKEYVSGYANIATTDGYGVSDAVTMDLGEGAGSQAYYTKAYVRLEPYYDSKKGNYYHPFAAMTWQKMRTDHPDLLTTYSSTPADPGSSDFDKAMKVKSLANIGPQIAKLRRGYMKQAWRRGWGRYMEKDKSVIRLCSPDGIKYGGGLRVKKITTSDDFSVNGSASQYGQVFDYTTEDENGNTISSGVAAFEPQIGGEENALKHANTYTQEHAYRTKSQLYFEYPINESYYPGASVGYSKVKVRSLTTDAVLDGTYSNEVGATGESIHEFYTAKEFPTIATETDMGKEPYTLFVPIPLIGGINRGKLTASQGYSVEVNDMHGKPKSVSYFGIENGLLMSDFPVSSVRYEYQNDLTSYEGIPVRRLNNTVSVGNSLEYSNVERGVQYEFFMDHVESKSYMINGGVDANLEIFGILGLPLMWPSYSEDYSLLRYMVANKVIHKAGVLKKVVATDGQSTVETENTYYHALTGEPVYVQTRNNFENDIYSAKAYSGDYGFNRIGDDGFQTDFQDFPVVRQKGAYEKYGAIGTITLSTLDTNSYPSRYEFEAYMKSSAGDYYSYTTNDPWFTVEIGSEFILKDGNGNLFHSTFMNVGHDPNAPWNNRVDVFYCNQNLSGDYEYFLVRAGERNVLSIPSQQISSLEDMTGFFSGSLATENITLSDASSTQDRYLTKVVSAQANALSEAWPKTKVMQPNPYASGELGIVRLLRNYSYRSDRKASGSPNLKQDGYFQGEGGNDRFYFLQNDHEYYNKQHPYWVATTITKYDNNGNAIESVNPIGVYSSSDYSFNGMLMNWEAVNAGNSEVYFNSFEDTDDLLLDMSDEPITTNSDAHTGKLAAKLTTNSEFKTSVVPAANDKEYFFSAWVKADEETFDYSANADAATRGVVLHFYNSDYSTKYNSSPLIEPVGEIVEGWQKVEGSFTMSSLSSNAVEGVSIEIKPGTVSSVQADIWIDDIRIMPNDANMKTYVYDPSTYRLSAILDENNYASLYHYDEEGNLFLVKKETREGLFTIQESRSYK